jgi:hypothetical protein
MGRVVCTIAIAPMERQATCILFDTVSFGRLVLLHSYYLTIDNSLIASDWLWVVHCYLPISSPSGDEESY